MQPYTVIFSWLLSFIAVGKVHKASCTGLRLMRREGRHLYRTVRRQSYRKLFLPFVYGLAGIYIIYWLLESSHECPQSSSIGLEPDIIVPSRCQRFARDDSSVLWTTPCSSLNSDISLRSGFGCWARLVLDAASTPRGRTGRSVGLFGMGGYAPFVLRGASDEDALLLIPFASSAAVDAVGTVRALVVTLWTETISFIWRGHGLMNLEPGQHLR